MNCLVQIKLIYDIWAPYGTLIKARTLNLDSLISFPKTDLIKTERGKYWRFDFSVYLTFNIEQ